MNTPLTEETFRAHERWLWQLTNSYAHKFPFLDRGDIYQELCEAAIIAWGKYDPETFGTKFITFLTPRCWMKIAKAAEGQHSIVRQNQTDEQRRAFWKGEITFDRSISMQSTYLTPDIELDGKDESTWEKGSERFTQATDEELPADEALIQDEECRFVHHIFEIMNLGEKDKWVVENRILTDEPWGLKHYTERFGQSMEAASQREKKLRKRFENEAKRALGLDYDTAWVDWEEHCKGGRPSGAKNKCERRRPNGYKRLKPLVRNQLNDYHCGDACGS